MESWTDELATGFSLIDLEHRLIFEHIAIILTAGEGADGRRAARAALDDFETHVAAHFERERALMKAVEYPGIASHLLAHEVLTTYVRELKRVMAKREASEDDVGTAVRLIANALVAHTSTHDRALARYLDVRR